MAEKTKIEWCDHTFNPWIGCTKVSPGCVNCYAEKSTRARVLRAGGQETWGKGAARSRTKTWDAPVKWNREAGKLEEAWLLHVELCRQSGVDAAEQWAAAGMAPWHRPRVFCASLADWLDGEVPTQWLMDLMDLIRLTPHLDWLLLTKRPENWRLHVQLALGCCDVQPERHSAELRAWIAGWLDGVPPANVWIGTTVEDQTRANERIPKLLEIPARVRFLSCEPLLGAVDLREAFYVGEEGGAEWAWAKRQMMHWVIAGGESGPGARPMHLDWARALRDQCVAAGVPFLFKQWGEWAPGCAAKEKDRLVTKPGELIGRFGKKRAGRRLDGREWDEFPKVEEVAR